MPVDDLERFDATGAGYVKRRHAFCIEGSYRRSALTGDERTYFQIDHVGLEDGAAVIALHGELDASAGGELRSTLCLLGQVFGTVVVDLSGLTFCDSGGLRVLRDAHDHLTATHGRLVLRGTARLLSRCRPSTAA